MKRFLVVALVAFMAFSASMTIGDKFVDEKSYFINKPMAVYFNSEQTPLIGVCVSYSKDFIIIRQSNKNAIIPVSRVKIIYADFNE